MVESLEGFFQNVLGESPEVFFSEFPVKSPKKTGGVFERISSRIPVSILAEILGGYPNWNLGELPEKLPDEIHGGRFMYEIFS